MKKRIMEKGFTLIELMIVVAIIAILAAIAIPQFANLVTKSHEGQTKGNLGTIRSALSVYYGDNEGWYPAGTSGANLIVLATSSKYMQVVPNADLPQSSNNLGHPTINTDISPTPVLPDDTGGWLYDNSGDGVSTWGNVVVNCTHQDLKGWVWTSD
jgi:prepilin-type N-terminal cleavage/methylation domain-containing protein